MNFDFSDLWPPPEMIFIMVCHDMTASMSVLCIYVVHIRTCVCVCVHVVKDKKNTRLFKQAEFLGYRNKQNLRK